MADTDKEIQAPYIVRIGEKEFPVDPAALGPDVRLDPIRGDRYLLHYRGRSIPVVLTSGTSRNVLITHAHRVFEAAVLDKRDQLLEAWGVGGVDVKAASELEAPMPGLVLKIHVEPGQRVQEGAPLLVLEAMKMENELRAEAPAIVKAIEVSAGDAVTKGQLLIRFEPAESE